MLPVILHGFLQKKFSIVFSLHYHVIISRDHRTPGLRVITELKCRKCRRPRCHHWTSLSILWICEIRAPDLWSACLCSRSCSTYRWTEWNLCWSNAVSPGPVFHTCHFKNVQTDRYVEIRRHLLWNSSLLWRRRAVQMAAPDCCWLAGDMGTLHSCRLVASVFFLFTKRRITRCCAFVLAGSLFEREGVLALGSSSRDAQRGAQAPRCCMQTAERTWHVRECGNAIPFI